MKQGFWKAPTVRTTKEEMEWKFDKYNPYIRINARKHFFILRGDLFMKYWGHG